MNNFDSLMRPRSRCCIIPDYIWHSMLEKGNAEQRKIAVRTLSLTSTFRQVRVARTEALAKFRASKRVARLALEGLLGRASAPQKDICIYDAKHSTNVPGTKVRCVGDAPSSDQTVNEAYDALNATFDFYSNIYGRNSIDDEGMPLMGVVHYDENYDNAFWDGKEMIFGDGDGTLFNRFTIAIDVPAHELTHGVTADEAGLIYWKQSGALNESMSDVMGSLVKQYSLNQTADNADWLIGQGLLAPGVNGVALRSMKAPGTAYDDPTLGGKDPQPANMSDYVNTATDNGGVHINSGIPNHAFYLIATALGGYAWEKAGVIWYETLRSPSLQRRCSFQRFAKLTLGTAGQIFGTDSVEQQAVREGWAGVGISI